MKKSVASQKTRDAVASIVIGQMAASLIEFEIDLTSTTAVTDHLVETGFGKPSIDACSAGAVRLANEITAKR